MYFFFQQPEYIKTYSNLFSRLSVVAVEYLLVLALKLLLIYCIFSKICQFLSIFYPLNIIVSNLKSCPNLLKVLQIFYNSIDSSKTMKPQPHAQKQKSIQPTTLNAQPKNPLWRWVQPNNSSDESGIKQSRKTEGEIELEIPPLRKKRQKSETISNFLKHLQVQVDEKDEKNENQSEIVSILDFKYSDSYCTQKRYVSGYKSILADSKFHIFLLTSSLKDIHTSLRDSLVTQLEFYKQDLEVLGMNTKKLVAKYEYELSQKCIQLKNLELNMRQQRLTNVEEKYRIENQLRQSEERNKQLEQKLLEAERKIKEEQQVTKNEKNYNKQLNELILKFHKKVQQLETKCTLLKKQHDFSLELEIEKLNQKYHQLLNEQAQNYELKLQNTKIKYENFIQNNMGSSYLDFSKVEEVSIDMTKSVTCKAEDLIWQTERPITETCTPEQKISNLCKKRQFAKQRMLENTSSPKSNTSGRRFARTSKPPSMDVPNTMNEKTQLAGSQPGQGNTSYLHSSLNQKFFLSQDKTPRNSDLEESNTNGRNIAIQHRQKSHLQSSQPELQFERGKRSKEQEHRSGMGKNLISIQINKILNNSTIQSNSYPAGQPMSKVGNFGNQADPGRVNSNQVTVSTSTSKINQAPVQNSGSGMSLKNNTSINKNIIYIDKRLRETIA